MGTLMDQPVRKPITGSDLEWVVDDIKKVAEKTGVSFENVLAARALELKHMDREIKDEQLAGFGEIGQQLVVAISEIGETLREGGT